jgi:1,2-diacylglycerol 3-alpha-glucosyltransferase
MSYVFFSDTYLPRRDGVAHSVAWSAEALRELGKDAILVRPHMGRGSSGKDICLPSSQAIHRDYYVSWSSYLRCSKRLLEKCGVDSSGVEIVHVHSLGPIGMLGLRYAWSKSIPTVLSWHTDIVSYADVYPEVYAGTGLALLQTFMLSHRRSQLRCGSSMSAAIRNLLLSVDSVVAPSVKTAARLSQICPEAAMSVIPTGLPRYIFSSRDKSRVRSDLDIAADDKLVLWVGRLSAEKNPGLLTASFQEIRSRRPNVRCIAVGDPGPGRRGRDWQRVLRNGGVDILPSIEHAELLKLYRVADLLLVTSLTETQGLTVVEAHAVGLPVVSVDPTLAFFGDMVMPNVWAVNTTTAKEVAAASLRVLDEHVTEAARSALSDHERIRLSATTQALRLIKVYELLSHSRTQQRFACSPSGRQGSRACW